MNRHILITICFLVSLTAQKANAAFDITSVEAYISDHKDQRSLLIARSALEESNKMLHGYSRDANVNYEDINAKLDKYTRAFDVIDLLYQSLSTGLNCYNTYNTISSRVSDYKDMLQQFNDKCISRGDIVSSDAQIITINYYMLDKVAEEGDNLLRSFTDLVAYASGAAACSTSDLMNIVTSINTSLDKIQKEINTAYFQTWRYIQVRIGYWKGKIYKARTKEEIIQGAFGRWRQAGKLDFGGE